MSPHILIVEDDRGLQDLLIDHFIQKYSVTTTDSVDRACDLIDHNQFDLAIIDRVLTDGDGLDIIAYLKDVQPQSRVIALSRLGRAEQRVTGLESGADDYLTKPFCLAELTIKVKKLLTNVKQQDQMSPQKTKYLRLNNHTAELTLPNRVVRLRRREAQILSVLLLYLNQVVSRQMIITSVWQNKSFIPNKTTLDVYIRRLRMRLGDQAGQIITVKGVGYAYQES